MADSRDGDIQLRQDLQEFGEAVGKINDKTRPILVKKLNHLRARQRIADAAQASPAKSGRSTGRGGKQSPAKKKALGTFSSSEDDNDEGNENLLSGTAAERESSTPKKSTNLRRRTVGGQSLSEVTNDADKSRGQTPPRPNTRRSVGSALSDSPFMAGSLRNPHNSSPAREPAVRRNGKTPLNELFVFNDDDTDDDKMEVSDEDYTFVEMTSACVNTTESLEKTGDVSRPKFNSSIDCVSSTEPTNEPSTTVWSARWHIVSQVLVYCLLAFFVGLIVVYAFTVFCIPKPLEISGKSDDFVLCRDNPEVPRDECLDSDEVTVIRELLLDIGEVLSQTAGAFECGYPVGHRYISKSDLQSILQRQYGRDNVEHFQKALLVIDKNEAWGLRLYNELRSKSADANDVQFLESVVADKSLWCRLTTSVWNLSYYILIAIAAVLLLMLVWLKVKSAKDEARNVQRLIKDIIGLLHNNSQSSYSAYLAIADVRDSLIPQADRKRKQSAWNKAVRQLATKEPRIREERRTINGKDVSVWRWIDNSANGSSRLSSAAARPSTQRSKICSAYLRVCNMLEPGRNYETNIIYDAVLDRCGSHAGILHIGTSSDVPDSVYVKFVSESAAGRAYQSLHGWLYNGKLTTVKEVGASMYRMLFPESVNAMVPLRSSASPGRRPSSNLYPSLPLIGH